MITLDHLRRATAVFDARLAGVTAEQWTAPTPCDRWTVRDLVDHVTGGNRFAVALLAGASIGDAFEAVLAPGFGDDVLGEYRTSVDDQLRAFAADGALDGICHHPAGDIPGSLFLAFRFGDVLVHAWDLAHATGGDEELGDELVAAAWEGFRQRGAGLTASGMFGSGPSGTVEAGAPLQTHLLDLVGRRP